MCQSVHTVLHNYTLILCTVLVLLTETKSPPDNEVAMFEISHESDVMPDKAEPVTNGINRKSDKPISTVASTYFNQRIHIPDSDTVSMF